MQCGGLVWPPGSPMESECLLLCPPAVEGGIGKGGGRDKEEWTGRREMDGEGGRERKGGEGKQKGREE